MFFWKTYDIADNQKALLYRRNRFDRILGPGRHRVQTVNGKITVAVYDTGETKFDHPQAKFLIKTFTDQLSDDLEYHEMSDHTVGLVYRDGHLCDILAPGSFTALWKGLEQTEVQKIDISENFDIEEHLVAVLMHRIKPALYEITSHAISYTEIADEHVGLLIVNGKLQRLLKPGRYGFWNYNRSIAVKRMDLRLQLIEVSGQEILTNDRVSLRINLSASYRMVDPSIVAIKLNDATNFVYRELQLGLREAVTAVSLDMLLEDKNVLNEVISKSTRGKLAKYGIELTSVGVKDIILPGDMKMILNQVVEAQKLAEANLIKRREETQAMRSLHNTAKMMDNNPMLLRLKELESLENITERIDNISVYGGLDGIMNNLVQLDQK